MVTHIVMFKFKPDCPPETVQEMRAGLLSLKDKIDLIRNWEVGLNVGASSRPYDLVVYSTFDSMEDVAAFRVNPDQSRLPPMSGSLWKSLVRSITKTKPDAGLRTGQWFVCIYCAP